MNILVFGGSFNPPHKGHVKLLQAAAQQVLFDLIYVIPTNVPPHKENKVVSGEHRVNMLNAIDWQLPVTVSDIELKREGKSYTFDTLSQLRELHPDDQLYFLIGSDMLFSFDKWYRYQDLLKMAHFCVSGRTDEDFALLAPYVQKLEEEGGHFVTLTLDPIEISSTDLRAMIAADEDTSEYLNQGVIKYIKENHLYETI